MYTLVLIWEYIITKDLNKLLENFIGKPSAFLDFYKILVVSFIRKRINLSIRKVKTNQNIKIHTPRGILDKEKVLSSAKHLSSSKMQTNRWKEPNHNSRETLTNKITGTAAGLFNSYSDYLQTSIPTNLSHLPANALHMLPTLASYTQNSTFENLDIWIASVGNNTTIATHTVDNLNSFYFYETEQFAVLWILFTVIVLGNSAVLFVMFMNKNRKSRMNYFIKQLALADLCVGLLNVLTDIIWRLTISWRAGNIACKIIRFLQVCVTYSSTYVLVAMSIDRYDAITHPMNFSKSWKRARHLVVGAWVTAATFSIPILLLYEEKLIEGQTQCWIELGSPVAWQIYMSLVAATLFAAPAVIISACYAIIVKTIWAKGSVFIPTEHNAGHAGSASMRRASSRGIIPRAKVKTVKMTLVIVIVFILCWSPYIIFDLLQVFEKIPRTQTNIAIATFIQSLAPLNSAANPLIYCIFSSQVFRTLSRFPPFKWLTCCCTSYRNNSTPNRCHQTVGRRLHNSCDSMRTFTTSLTVSRRSNKPAARVIICEHAKVPTSHAMSAV